MSYARKNDGALPGAEAVRNSPAKAVRGVDRVEVGAEELRKFFKHYLDGDALVVVGVSWRTRALLMPLKPELHWRGKEKLAHLRRLKALWLAELKRIVDGA